jgi:hypothetical protein
MKGEDRRGEASLQDIPPIFVLHHPPFGTDPFTPSHGGLVRCTVYGNPRAREIQYNVHQGSRVVVRRRERGRSEDEGRRPEG